MLLPEYHLPRELTVYACALVLVTHKGTMPMLKMDWNHNVLKMMMNSQLKLLVKHSRCVEEHADMFSFADAWTTQRDSRANTFWLFRSRWAGGHQHRYSLTHCRNHHEHLARKLQPKQRVCILNLLIDQALQIQKSTLNVCLAMLKRCSRQRKILLVPLLTMAL